MPTPVCIYCGCNIRPDRGIKGHKASNEQLQQAALFHFPQVLKGTYICNTHLRHPPSLSLKLKRARSPSQPSSDLPTKRQRASETLSTSRPPQQPPTSSSSESTSVPYLVRPFQHALANSTQSFPSTESLGPIDTTASTPQQWRSHHDSLRQRVLSPHHRFKQMRHIVSSLEQPTRSHPSKSTNGRYLRVFDVHTHHGVVDEDDTNLIKQLIASATVQVTTEHAMSDLRCFESYDVSCTITPISQRKVIAVASSNHLPPSMYHQFTVILHNNYN